MKINEGDIFRWRYRDEKLNGDYLSYWAKSCIAIAKDGRLLDTYWGGVSDSTNWGYGEALRCLKLDRIGNFTELENRPEHLAEYYDEADYVNLNHANSPKGNFYIRKGAKRSAEKMREMLEYKIEKERADIRSAERTIVWLTNQLNALKAGAPLEEVHV